MLEKLDSSQLIGLSMVFLVLMIIATVLFFAMRKEKGDLNSIDQ